MLLIGAGIGTGVLSNTEWSDAYDVSAGTLMVQVLSPLGGFGYFCAVVLSLGLISNNIPGQYSAALSFQLLGSWFKIIPRFIWVFVGTVIYTVLACVGRDQFFTIFEDFLALMGYWVFMWIIMTIEEEFIFRRRYEGHWYNWEVWNNPEALPIGIAALICFLIGWVRLRPPYADAITMILTDTLDRLGQFFACGRFTSLDLLLAWLVTGSTWVCQCPVVG